VVARAGMVHHDIKPDNIVRHSDGRVALIDFGYCLPAEGEKRYMPADCGTILWSSVRHVSRLRFRSRTCSRCEKSSGKMRSAERFGNGR
jgi:serine/threonine protein kinase